MDCTNTQLQGFSETREPLPSKELPLTSLDQTEKHCPFLNCFTCVLLSGLLPLKTEIPFCAKTLDSKSRTDCNWIYITFFAVLPLRGRRLRLESLPASTFRSENDWCLHYCKAKTNCSFLILFIMQLCYLSCFYFHNRTPGILRLPCGLLFIQALSRPRLSHLQQGGCVSCMRRPCPGI